MADGGSKGVFCLDTPAWMKAGVSFVLTLLLGWKLGYLLSRRHPCSGWVEGKTLSTAGSPWPRSDRGEVFLIFVGFLLLCQLLQSVCLLSHSVTGPGFGGLGAGST